MCGIRVRWNIQTFLQMELIAGYSPIWILHVCESCIRISSAASDSDFACDLEIHPLFFFHIFWAKLQHGSTYKCDGERCLSSFVSCGIQCSIVKIHLSLTFWDDHTEISPVVWEMKWAACWTVCHVIHKPCFMSLVQSCQSGNYNYSARCLPLISFIWGHF